MKQSINNHNAFSLASIDDLGLEFHVFDPTKLHLLWPALQLACHLVGVSFQETYTWNNDTGIVRFDFTKPQSEEKVAELLDNLSEAS